MPSKSSKQTSQGSLQETALQKKFDKFCQDLSKAKKKGGEIRDLVSLNSIKEALRSRRNKGGPLNDSIMVDILAQLENNGHDICSQIEPSIFCCIIEAALQANPSRGCQRIVHLLGASLHRDSKSAEATVQALPLRKEAIGKECLVPLLEYYVKVDNSVALRRWVGILCVQLFLDCDKNQERIEMASEDWGRSLGRLIIDDPDEILRMISGQLVRNLVDTGIPLASFFPANYGEHMYEDFPASTPNNVGWFKGFQDYLDGLAEKPGSQTASNLPASAGTLYYATFVILEPGPKFGVDHHNVFVFMDSDQKLISIMSTAKGDKFDQIIDIPPTEIQRMTITINTQSQRALAIVDLYLTGAENTGVLDGQAVKLNKVSMRLMPTDANLLKEELDGVCPGLEIHDSTQLSQMASSDERNESQVTHTSTVEILVNTESQSTQIPAKPRHVQQPVAPAKGSSIPFNIPPKSKIGFPKLRNIATKEIELEEEVAMPVDDEDGSPLPNSPTPPVLKLIQRNGVKPKAKKPLVITRRSLDSQISQSAAGPSQTAPKSKHQLAISPKTFQAASAQASMGPSKLKQSTQLLPSDPDDIYDIPADEDEKKPKSADKAKKKQVVANSKATAKAKASITKQTTDKRKSAPAVLALQNSQTRRSQRVAATEANKKLIDSAGSDNEFEAPLVLIADRPSKSKSQEANASPASALMGPPDRPKQRGAAVFPNKDKNHAPLPYEEVHTPGSPEINLNGDSNAQDDLYTASPAPKKASQDESKVKSQDLVTNKRTIPLWKGKAGAVVEKTVVVEEAMSLSEQFAAEKAKTKEAINGLADGLNDILGDIESSTDVEKSESLQGSPTKTAKAQRELTSRMGHRVGKQSMQVETAIAVQAVESSAMKVANDHILSDLPESIESLEDEPQLGAEPGLGALDAIFRHDVVSQIDVEPRLDAMDEEPEFEAKLQSGAEPQVEEDFQINEDPQVDVQARVEVETRVDTEPQLNRETGVDETDIPEISAPVIHQSALTAEKRIDLDNGDLKAISTTIQTTAEGWQEAQG